MPKKEKSKVLKNQFYAVLQLNGDLVKFFYPLIAAEHYLKRRNKYARIMFLNGTNAKEIVKKIESNYECKDYNKEEFRKFYLGKKIPLTIEGVKGYTVEFVQNISTEKFYKECYGYNNRYNNIYYKFGVKVIPFQLKTDWERLKKEIKWDPTYRSPVKHKVVRPKKSKKIIRKKHTPVIEKPDSMVCIMNKTTGKILRVWRSKIPEIYSTSKEWSYTSKDKWKKYKKNSITKQEKKLDPVIQKKRAAANARFKLEDKFEKERVSNFSKRCNRKTKSKSPLKRRRIRNNLKRNQNEEQIL